MRISIFSQIGKDHAMTGRDVLKVICMTVCIVCSGFSWAQDDATVSARKLADDHINSTFDPSLKGFDHVDPINYGHVIGLHYSEQKDIGEGWTWGRGGPTIFVDTEKMSVVGVMRPVPASRPVFVGANMSDELASNVISYFRKTAPDFDIANYNFSVADAGDISYLYVVRKSFDRGIYKCNCALVVENRTNQILGNTFSFEEHYEVIDHGDSMFYPKTKKWALRIPSSSPGWNPLPNARSSFVSIDGLRRTERAAFDPLGDNWRTPYQGR
jgi:hypothetical protein